jgi:hypothetical protein
LTPGQPLSSGYGLIAISRVCDCEIAPVEPIERRNAIILAKCLCPDLISGSVDIADRANARTFPGGVPPSTVPQNENVAVVGFCAGLIGWDRNITNVVSSAVTNMLPGAFAIIRDTVVAVVMFGIAFGRIARAVVGVPGWATSVAAGFLSRFSVLK